jgi:hypothetical protein
MFKRQEYETRSTPFLIVVGCPKPRIRRSKQKEKHGEQAWPRVRHFTQCIADELNVMHDKWARQSMINPSKGQEIVYKELESSFCKAKTSRV